jgi:hypothetical protein
MSRMSKKLAPFAWVLLLFQMQPVFPQTTQPVLNRFRHERALIPGGPGSNRLQIDSALLSGGDSQWQFRQEGAGSEREPMIIATGGLADLRIYDSSNREVPYLFILPLTPEPQWLDGRLAPLAPTKNASGFQIDLGRSLLVDRLRLGGLPAPFVKRCILEASDNAGHWRPLRTDATVFDLPSEKLKQLEIEFREEECRSIRIVWDDRVGARLPLPRSASARLVSAGALAPAMQVALQFERRQSEPMVSRYRLRLPGPRLPITQIKLTAKGGNILRQARITEGRLSGGEMLPSVLGSATLRREVRGELSAAQMTIPIQPPQETTLELTIEDGNNPPLEITEISAVFAYLPWIYFESSGKNPLTARYGYPGLKAPRYDLEAARFSAAKTRTIEAQWGEAHGIEAEMESFADNEVPSTGSVIDLASFRYARRIKDGKAGLCALPLDAAVLAHSRMADLRIAPADGHQIPYLMEKADEPLSLNLPPLEKAQLPETGTQSMRQRTGSQSCYRLRLPYQDLPDARLVFTTTARVFRRNIAILIERNPFNERQEPWTFSVAEATWSHSDPEFQAQPLSVKIPSLKTVETLVVVEEGDNSPLPITSVRLLLPSYRMRFFRGNKADLKLYYGRSDLATPHYDLAILASRLIGAKAEETLMDPENAPTPMGTHPLSLKLFWGVLAIAVLVLLALIARLVKKI